MRNRILALGLIFGFLAGAGSHCVKAEDLRSSVSPDSLPGWTPLQTDQDAALAIAMGFLQRIDQGSYAQAYAMMAGSMKALAPETVFEAMERTFKIKAGPLVERRPTAITWTNHPANMRNPGIFAAIDFVIRYENIDRACSYVVLIKAGDGSGMRVIRSQMASLDNASALNIAAKHSPAAVDQVWHALSRQYPNCPA